MLGPKLFFLDPALDRIAVIRRIRSSPLTIWTVSSMFLFIDTFIYALTFASLPDMLQNKMHTAKSANGVVTAIFGVGSVIGSVFVMLFSDRYSVRRPLQLLGAVFYIVSGAVFYFADHFYQVVLFRLVNGIASGTICTLLYTTVGDVYPTNLLGFKVAIIHFCNTIAYTIGPICGEMIFHKGGIPAIASVVISLGVLGFGVVFTLVEDSLVIRKTLKQQDREKLSDTPSAADHEEDGAPLDALGTSENTELSCEHRQSIDEQQDQSTVAPKMTVWRLLLKIHVIVPTLVTIVAIGIQCMLESVVPLNLDDTSDGPSKSGITFVIFGLALTLFVPMVGKVNDVIISRYGERMRYYMMMFGSVTSILAITLMALAKNYIVMVFGYVLYAVTNLCMWIPAKSAYGDFLWN
ncbi:hypothetical protein EV175_000107 [Coemansia sp. RSA 1933]|nr:hypothetical protein EV175_000107 [Coemansia sp. RSA 1933]